MADGSFAAYLAGLDETGLTTLLRNRPDVRVAPAPRSFSELAERLSGPESLRDALAQLDHDCVLVCEGIAVLGASATEAGVAHLLGAEEQLVSDQVAELCSRGLAWKHADTVRLPDLLADHFSDEIGGGRPVDKIARSAPVTYVRTAASKFGIEVGGLRKPEVIEQLAERLTDAPAVAEVVRNLSEPQRERLDELRHGSFLMPWFGSPRAGIDRTEELAKAGLVFHVNHRWEVPREVAVGAWLAERETAPVGPPTIPEAAVPPEDVRGTAQTAVHDLVRAVTALLDEARTNPLKALKKGGVGTRERSRVAGRLALPPDVVLLAIDLASAADLLGFTASGYAPSGTYASWRESSPVRQWATLAVAWFGMEHAATCREIDDGKEHPPPLPLASGAGLLRRALLRGARGGRSVEAVREAIDWFCPLHGYESSADVAPKADAAVREGELLGVVASDVLTECGEHLLAAVADDTQDPVAELADRVAPVFPEVSCTVVLQSDLTAVVSGQPSASVSTLLGDAAGCETRGTATIWRFTKDSVRNALDSGWTVDGLLAELTAVSNHSLPQPLEYLVTDVGRLHGQVRVRGMRACVVADEATATEILHTRRLSKLQLARLAPTVLSSPCDLDEVLKTLRTAGFAPVAEDAQGAAVIEERAEHRAPGAKGPMSAAVRDRLGADELAARLRADPNGEAATDLAESSDTVLVLAELTDRLTHAELVLLADALDQQRDVVISYRDKKGNRTRRKIQPGELYGRWLVSWCYLRDGEREFTVANIESVGPA